MTSSTTESASEPGAQIAGTPITLVAAVAALGGLLFGYDTGVISGALLYMNDTFTMSSTQEGWVTAMLLVGAAVGAASGGRIADGLGRRLTMICGGALFVLGAIWCAFAGSVSIMGWGRLILGLAVGAVSIVVPMYISEMAPPAQRGRLVSLNTWMIVVGQLASFLVNSLLASSGNWRLMLGLAAVPGLIFGIGMFFMPESTGKVEQRVSSREWAALKEKWVLISVVIAIFIGITQQISGVNAVMYFTPTMMNKVGIPTDNSIYTSIVIGVVSVIACYVGLRIVDRVGRRRLLTIGLIGNITSLALLAALFNFATGSAAVAYLCLALMALFVAFQQAAVSLTTWLLISEIVPLQVRGVGMGIAGFCLWAANWAVAQFFLPMVDAITGAGAFAVFACLGAVSLVFVRLCVPETTGRGLEQVSAELKSRWS